MSNPQVNLAGGDLGVLKTLAPRVGFEPTTLRLTAECSTVELPRSSVCYVIYYSKRREKKSTSVSVFNDSVASRPVGPARC